MKTITLASALLASLLLAACNAESPQPPATNMVMDDRPYPDGTQK